MLLCSVLQYSGGRCNSVELSAVHGGVRYFKKSMHLKIALSHTCCLELAEWSKLLSRLTSKSVSANQGDL